MSSDAGIVSTATRPRLRFRFSLLALLVLITLACLFLGWWQFVHLERQRFIARRAVLAAHVKDLSTEYKRKWDDYLDIARGMNNAEDGGRAALLQVDLKRLDRLDEESLRIENELYDLKANGEEKELDIRVKQLAERRKQREQLRKEIEQGSQQSADLKTFRAELDHLQRMIDTLSEELEWMDMEAEVRGIPSK